MPQKSPSLLSATGSNFGLGRVQPTRQQGLATLGLLADLTPAGDVMAMGSGLANRDALGFGLGAASLLLPGTIKPQAVDPVVKAVKRKFFTSNIDKAFEGMGRGDFLAINPDRKRALINRLEDEMKSTKDKYPSTFEEKQFLRDAVENMERMEFRTFDPKTRRVMVTVGTGNGNKNMHFIDVDDLEPWDL